MDKRGESTLLGKAAGSIGRHAAEGRASNAERRRQLVGLSEYADGRRHLFGVGEGLAVAKAKQERTCAQSPIAGRSRAGEGDRQRMKEKRDVWRLASGAGECKSGLHEPADCTKICTNRAPLALRRLYASSTFVS